MDRGDLQLLGATIKVANTQTGACYPGNQHLADTVIFYDRAKIPHHYSLGTIRNKMADIVDRGYLCRDRRAVEGKGRAVTHYLAVVPNADYLQEQVTEWCRNFNRRSPDVTPETMTSGSDADVPPRR